MRSDPKQIEYTQIHTIDGEVTRQAAPIIQRIFETNEVLPIKKFIHLTHKVNSGTMHGEAFEKSMEKLERLVLDMHDNNLDDSYKTVIELATHVVNTIKQTALNSTDTEVDLEASLEAPLKALEDERQRLDRHIRYSLFKGATCQTFSSIALTYLVNEQNRRLNSPLDIYSAQRNIIYQLNAERDDGTVFMDHIFKYGLISDLSIKDQLEALYGMGLSRDPDKWPLLIKMTYSDLINDDAVKGPTDDQKTEMPIANQSSS